MAYQITFNVLAGLLITCRKQTEGPVYLNWIRHEKSFILNKVVRYIRFIHSF
jgi:hypothetical protein